MHQGSQGGGPSSARTRRVFAADPADLLCLGRRVTRDLAADPSLDDLVTLIHRSHQVPLGLAGVAVVCRHADSVEVISSAGFDHEQVEPFRTIPLGHPLPLTEAARTGFEVFVSDTQEREERYPLLDGADPRSVALAAIPVINRREVIGAVGFGFAQPVAFDPPMADYLWQLSHLCGLTMARDHNDRDAHDPSRPAKVVLLRQHEASVEHAAESHQEPNLIGTPRGEASVVARRLDHLEMEVRSVQELLHFISEILNDRFGRS